MNTSIYLDYHATTPCDPEVLEAMLPFFSTMCANSSSSIHEAGRMAAKAVEIAREQVACLLGATSGEIVFTSGATESNNIALLGLTKRYRGPRKRIVTTAVEHKSVLSPCQALAEGGFEVVVLPVDSEGSVLLAAAREAINNDTLFVSVQVANNEVGTLQPVQQIAAIARECGALVHCDAAQAIGKIPFDVDAWGVDMASFSAHKFYGPQGVGGLYLRGRGGSTPWSPLALGGGQERGLRPGTLNLPGIVGMGKACALCQEKMVEDHSKTSAIRDRLEAALLANIPGLERNGAIQNRLPGNSNLTLPGLDADILLARLSHIAMSTGSACSSSAIEPSHVLIAMGRSNEEAYSTIRLGLGRFTTQIEIDVTADAIADIWSQLAYL